MRFMNPLKVDNSTEAGVLAHEKRRAEMGKEQDELAKAGVLLAARGPRPRSNGLRVKLSGAKRSVIDGPFTETKELVK